MDDIDTRLETLQARIDRAIELNGTTDPKALVQSLEGETAEVYAIEDLPSPSLRAMMGYGHDEPFKRAVIHRPDGVPWPYTPSMCLVSGGITGVWVDAEHLTCPGCGLDFT